MDMIVVFSGYNQRAVISFLRTLQKNKIDDYTIIASCQQDLIFMSKYKCKVSYIRESKDFLFDEISGIIKLLRRKNDKIWIAPTTEYINRFFLRNREYFNDLGCVLPLVEEKIYSLVSDKKTFCALCEHENILVPHEVGFPVFFEKPIIAKPICYGACKEEIFSPVFIRNESEYSEFVHTYDKNKFFYQEFLENGESIYLLFYFDRNGEYHVFSQKNLAQQFGGKSIVAAIGNDSYKDEKLVMPYVNMFRKICFYGLVMVEIRMIDNKAYMIEANPRFWGPSQLFCDAGVNFFELLLHDYGIIKRNISWEEKEKITYFWSGGIECENLEGGVLFYNGGEEYVYKNMDKFMNNNIYMKEDTEKIYIIERLRQLYMKSSKHSNYQILSRPLECVVGKDTVRTKSRQEMERLEYALSKIDISGRKILDIGGNTGFFTIEAACGGASNVAYYEGNYDHAEFVKLAVEMLGLNDKIEVYNEYFLFKSVEETYDVIFNLNVIHHLGEDFLEVGDIDKAKERMIECINSLAKCSQFMVFQMGFNWMGKSELGLFEGGTKGEMIEFIKNGTDDYWEMENIGIAEQNESGVIYKDMNKTNIVRNDSLGEFLNRPIFIMKSKLR